MDALYFKACPKCRGDVIVDNDPYGWFFKCLQCGLLRDVASVPVVDVSHQEVEVMAEPELDVAYL